MSLIHIFIQLHSALNIFILPSKLLNHTIIIWRKILILFFVILKNNSTEASMGDKLKMLLSIRSKHSSLFLFSNINRVAFDSAIIWSDEYPNHLSFPPKFLSNLF